MFVIESPLELNWLERGKQKDVALKEAAAIAVEESAKWEMNEISLSLVRVQRARFLSIRFN